MDGDQMAFVTSVTNTWLRSTDHKLDYIRDMIRAVVTMPLPEYSCEFRTERRAHLIMLRGPLVQTIQGLIGVGEGASIEHAVKVDSGMKANGTG